MWVLILPSVNVLQTHFPLKRVASTSCYPACSSNICLARGKHLYSRRYNECSRPPANSWSRIGTGHRICRPPPDQAARWREKHARQRAESLVVADRASGFSRTDNIRDVATPLGKLSIITPDCWTTLTCERQILPHIVDGLDGLRCGNPTPSGGWGCEMQ